MKKVVLLSVIYLFSFATVSAQSVDLIWQGDTYTAPFYEGASLWTDQADITLLAIPQGLGSSSSLNYKWTKNGTVLGTLSGVGKNSLTFTGPVISRPQNIKVEIMSSDSKVLASNSVSITSRDPELILYENNPLYGFMFHREIGSTYRIGGQETTLTAFPFFFSAASRNDANITFGWETSAGKESGDSVTYRIPDGAVGNARVTTTIKSSGKILQSAGRNLLIQFGNNE